MGRLIPLLILLLSTCTTRPALAESKLSLTITGGLTTFIGPTLPDGIWYQQGLNYNMDNGSVAWGASLDYAFNPKWKASLGYRNVGTTRIGATFVHDDDYDLKTKSCTAYCYNTGNLTASDAMQLIELSGTRTWRSDDDYFIGLRAGAAYAFHRFSVENYNQTFAQKHYGNLPMGLIGMSVGYKWASIETAYYQQIGSGTPSSYPISTMFVLTTVNITIPLRMPL